MISAGLVPFCNQVEGASIGGWMVWQVDCPIYVQLAASALWDSAGDRDWARCTFVAEAEGRFAVLWRDLQAEERSILRLAMDG